MDVQCSLYWCLRTSSAKTLRFCCRSKFELPFRVAYVWKLHCYAVRLRFWATAWIALVWFALYFRDMESLLRSIWWFILSFSPIPFSSCAFKSHHFFFFRFSFTLLRFYSENKSIVELIVALYVLCLSIGSCQNGQNAIITIPTTKYRIKRDR